MKKFLQRFSDIILSIAALLLGIWVCGVAKWMWNFTGLKLVLWCAALLVMWCSGLIIRRARWTLLGLEMAVLLFFLLLTPEKAFEKQEWIESCIRIPEVVRKDDRIIIHNVRAFKYRTSDDFDPVYRTLELKPDKLESLDILFSHWDEMYEVAHMMVCFNFSDGQRLAASVEPRVKKGYYSGDFFWGIYKQYGLFFLLSVPEDALDLRLHFRGETLYRYRTTARGEVLKKMFEKLICRVEDVQDRVEFYHTLNKSCTTEFLQVLAVEPALRNWDWRQYINGFYPEYLFEKGFLEHRKGESFGSLRERSYVPGLSRGSE